MKERRRDGVEDIGLRPRNSSIILGRRVGGRERETISVNYVPSKDLRNIVEGLLHPAPDDASIDVKGRVGVRLQKNDRPKLRSRLPS